jgi:general secretion pathway protein K
MSARERGGALLAVLWLSAALTAIAFSVAISVRGDISRVEAEQEGVQAQFMAKGALERAILYMTFGPGERLPNGLPRYWDPERPLMVMPFSNGQAVVEVIPESAKVNVNTARPEELARLLGLLGLPFEAAQQLTAAIIDWRSPGQATPFDSFYLNQFPSFRAPHASLEEIEELLFVQGVTPELYYGRFERGFDGSIIPVPGLRDVLTVYPAYQEQFDINTSEAPVLAFAGVPLPVVQRIIEHRRMHPFLRAQFDAVRGMLGPGTAKVALGGIGPFFTLRATARVFGPDGRLKEARRTVSAVVRVTDGRMYRAEELVTVMRWRETDSRERLLFQVWPQQ